MSFRPMLPLWGLILVFLPLLSLGMYLMLRRRRRSGTSRWTGLRLVTATVLLLFIGLRPTMPDQDGEMLELDVDVVFAVDVTISMAAEDYAGADTRLDGVRSDMATLIEDLPGARYSMVTYGAFVRTEVPFTTDANAVMSAADILAYEFNHTSRGTALAPIVDPLDELLERAETSHPDRTRIVVFFGDGEETVDEPEPFDFAPLAERVGGGIVLGYGTEVGGPMRSRMLSFGGDEPTGAYLRDPETGQDALSIIDEGNLNLIAEQLGVPYEHRSEPGPVEGLDAVLEAASHVAAEEAEDATTVRDVHWWFAIPLMALAVIEVVIAARRMFDIPRITRRRSP